MNPFEKRARERGYSYVQTICEPCLAVLGREVEVDPPQYGRPRTHACPREVQSAWGAHQRRRRLRS